MRSRSRRRSTDETRPGSARARLRARAKTRRILSASLLSGSGLLLLVAIGLLVARFAGVSGDVNVYLHGSGVDSLQPGAPVALGVRRIGQVERVKPRDGQLVAHLVLDREQAGGIPASSAFHVESLNHWLPGNLGVRVSLPAETQDTEALELEPIRNNTVVAASHQFLPPEIPVRFYVLLAAALLAIVVIFGLVGALSRLLGAAGRWLILLLGAALLLAAYSYFSGQITAPEAPLEFGSTPAPPALVSTEV